MTPKYTALTDELHDYLVAHGSRQDEVLSRLAAETAELGDIAVMQIAPDQGALITLLVRAIGATRALELGTFTGYSAICIARGLPVDGGLVACELDEGYAEVARRYFADARVAERIELRLGPAIETLRAMRADELYDFVFIDADKQSYGDYYELCLEHLRPGGLMMLDNVLMRGRVLDPQADDEGARVVAELNDRIAADERVDVAMLAVADGITLAMKRGAPA